MGQISNKAYENRGQILKHGNEKIREMTKKALETNIEESNSVVQFLTDEYGDFSEWPEIAAKLLGQSFARIVTKGTIH